jgi:hypothetical protein
MLGAQPGSRARPGCPAPPAASQPLASDLIPRDTSCSAIPDQLAHGPVLSAARRIVCSVPRLRSSSCSCSRRSGDCRFHACAHRLHGASLGCKNRGDPPPAEAYILPVAMYEKSQMFCASEWQLGRLLGPHSPAPRGVVRRASPGRGEADVPVKRGDGIGRSAPQARWYRAALITTRGCRAALPHEPVRERWLAPRWIRRRRKKSPVVPRRRPQ